MDVELGVRQDALVEEEGLIVDPRALAKDRGYVADLLERINGLTIRGIPERLRRLEEKRAEEATLKREQIEAAEDTRHWGITELDFSS